MESLQALFLDELADIYNAEKQLAKGLGKMAKAANSQDLREAFESHMEETEQQIQRLEEVFERFGKSAKGKKCKAMEGLIAEGQEILKEHKNDPSLDAALISASQKIEHYEIATYGTLCTWAKLLESKEALKLLKQSIDEEEKMDKKLTQLAESHINLEAKEQEAPQARSSGKKTATRRSTTLRVPSKRR